MHCGSGVLVVYESHGWCVGSNVFLPFFLYFSPFRWLLDPYIFLLWGIYGRMATGGDIWSSILVFKWHWNRSGNLPSPNSRCCCWWCCGCLAATALGTKKTWLVMTVIVFCYYTVKGNVKYACGLRFWSDLDSSRKSEFHMCLVGNILLDLRLGHLYHVYTWPRVTTAELIYS